MQDILPWIRLTKTGASARRLNSLVDHFGSPEAFFDASVAEICAAAGCGPSVAEKLLDPAYAANPRDLKLIERLKIRILPRTDPDSPPLLREIHDPPPALYVRGTLAAQDQKAI